MNNPEAFRRVNRALQKDARFSVKDIQDNEWYNMREKYFYLDHTAEILENYRRLQENKIFDKVLHDERATKACLKLESRKVENILGSREHVYLEGTD